MLRLGEIQSISDSSTFVATCYQPLGLRGMLLWIASVWLILGANSAAFCNVNLNEKIVVVRVDYAPEPEGPLRMADQDPVREETDFLLSRDYTDGVLDAEIHALFDFDQEQRWLGASVRGATRATFPPLLLGQDASSFVFTVFDVTEEPESVYIAWSGTRVDERRSRLLVSFTANSGIDPIPTRDYDSSSSVTMDSVDELFMLPPDSYTFTTQVQGNAEFDLAMRFGAVVWREAMSGNFSDGDRWTGGIAPMADDELIFDAVEGPYTVTFDDSYTARGALVRRGTAEFDLTNNTLSVGDFTVLPGRDESVSLTITGGNGGPVVVSAFPSAADARGPTSGMGSGNPPPQLIATALNISGGTSTQVDISADSVFDTVTLNARAVVSGNETHVVVVGSENQFFVGSNGAGTLSIEDGATLISVAALTIGEEADSEGTVVVQEGVFRQGDIATIGKAGRGELLIRPGALAEFLSNLAIGANDGSAGLVTVQANPSEGMFGTLQIGGTLEVGASGTGELVVLGGDVGRDQQSQLTVNVGQNGTIHVDQRGQMTAQQLNVGTGPRPDFATVRISDRSLMHVTSLPGLPNSGSATVGVNGIGHFIVEGTSLTERGQLMIDRELEIGMEGIVEVAGHGIIVVGQSRPSGRSGELVVGPGGLLKGTGAIGGNLRIAGGNTAFHGIFSPGTSPGTFTVDGDFELEQGGVLEIEFAGSGDGESDRVVVSGDANLDGTILLEFIDNFAPSQGDTFSILDVGSMLSTGPNVQYVVQNLAPGFEFDISLENGGLTVVALKDATFVPEPAAYALLTAGALVVVVRRRSRSFKRVHDQWPVNSNSRGHDSL